MRVIVQVRAEVPVSVRDPDDEAEVAWAVAVALGPMNVTVWEVEDIEIEDVEPATPAPRRLAR